MNTMLRIRELTSFDIFFILNDNAKNVNVQFLFLSCKSIESNELVFWNPVICLFFKISSANR